MQQKTSACTHVYNITQVPSEKGVVSVYKANCAASENYIIDISNLEK